MAGGDETLLLTEVGIVIYLACMGAIGAKFIDLLAK